MKRILYLFLESGEAALEAYSSIKKSGYNGTLIESASLRHALLFSEPEDRHFFSLSAYEASLHKEESTFAMFIVDEDKLESLKETIREHTDSFHKVKGAMFSKKIEDYEGVL